MDPRYPVTSLGVNAAHQSEPDRGPSCSWSIPPLDASKINRLAVICCRPLHHVLEFSQLFSFLEELRELAPGIEIKLWIRSALRDWTPFSALPAHSLESLPDDRDESAWRVSFEPFKQAGSRVLVLDPADEFPRMFERVTGIAALSGGSFHYSASARESPRCATASDAFYRALASETPRWLGKPIPSFLSSHPQPRFLVHQSRFRVGNTLWLTPLLRSIRLFFPKSHITVVGSRTTERVLKQARICDDLLVVDLESKKRRSRLVHTLRQRGFDAAVFALVRRPKSRWLAEAVAEMDVKHRINLEYFDDESDGRRASPLFTHEAWFFWCTIASARFLLHGLTPFLGKQSDRNWLDDRRLEFPIRESWRQEAERVLSERGIGKEPFVLLAPGGQSSQRWSARCFGALAARVADEFGVHVLLEGGPGDDRLLSETGDWFGRLRRSRKRIVTARDSLGVLTALLERSSLLISNDSAPIHFAEVTQTPALYFSHHEKLTHSHPDCRAHWALYDTFRNRVENIPVDAAFKAIDSMIRNGDVQLERR